MFVFKSFVATAAILLKSTATFASPAPVVSLREANAFDPSVYNDPSNGTPSHYFAASSSLPVQALAEAATKGSNKLESFPLGGGGNNKVPIYGDWANLDGVGAYYRIADMIRPFHLVSPSSRPCCGPIGLPPVPMDVDCDGLNYKCKGNDDGQDETNFGALSAYAVPWFVSAHKSELKGNNVVAVICGGKMFYSIFGDADGDSPQVIGEGSWLLARTCFPNDNLNGASGHAKADVTCNIAFTGSNSVLPSSAHNSNYITDYDKLRSMGDDLVSKLVQKVKL